MQFVQACMLSKQHFHQEVFLFQWSMETHTFVATLGEFMPTVEDVLHLTHLILRQGKCNWNQIREVDQVKLNYLLTAMTTSSKKQTYAIQSQFFDERDGNYSNNVVEAFLVNWLSCYMLPVSQKINPTSTVFPLQSKQPKAYDSLFSC